MIEHINGVELNYINYGNKKGKTVVLLHGWGQNIEMMKPIGDNISDEYHIIIIDLPGFGSSSEPTYPWTLYDYVDAIKVLLDKLKIDKPIIVGHSFGGKITLLYASMYETEKIVLLASPYDTEQKTMSLKTKALKTLKKIPGINQLSEVAKKYIGSTDYKNASTMMRKILVDHVNLDITSNLNKIKSPSLIIWGTNDEAVNIKKAYDLEKLIDNAGLVIYENCTHYAYLERLDQTINVLKVFFKGE